MADGSQSTSPPSADEIAAAQATFKRLADYQNACVAEARPDLQALIDDPAFGEIQTLAQALFERLPDGATVKNCIVAILTGMAHLKDQVAALG